MELIHFSIDPHVAYHPLSWMIQPIPAVGGVTPTTSYQVITWLQTDATIHTVRHVRVASQSDVPLFGRCMLLVWESNSRFFKPRIFGADRGLTDSQLCLGYEPFSGISKLFNDGIWVVCKKRLPTPPLHVWSQWSRFWVKHLQTQEADKSP